METEALPEKIWLSSQELLAKYSVKASYANAARAAKRIVIEHNLPFERKGNKWYRTVKA